jgi:hypothetical protein
MRSCRHLLILACGLFLAAAFATRADVLELVNGDQFRGTVLSLTQSNVEFQSESLGRITLPRDKVARVTFREPAVATPVAKPIGTNTPSHATGPSLIMAGTNHLSPAPAPGSAEAALQQLRQNGLDPKLVTQVQQQVFGQANPEAAQKFDELMGGLMSGAINIQDLRAQAQTSIQQIQDAKQALGPDLGDMFDGYLAILQNFVTETATNSPPPPVK